MTFHPTTNPVFWKETGQKLLEEERYYKAAEAFQKLTELTPNDPEAWRGKGVALLELQKYAESANSFEQTLILLPDDLISLKGLAAACKALGESDKMAACIIRINDLSQNLTD